jgi:sulfur carrier protein
MQITVNGELRRVEPQTTVLALLQQMSLADKRIAVERNGEIVPRSRHAATPLEEGDRLEVVVAVGGG